jgi:RND family efflux transporter MFP subunit
MKFLQFLKKPWVIILLVVIIGLIVWRVQVNKTNSAETYVTSAVLRGKLTQTVSATGKVESVSATNLNFKASGTVQKIYVKAGDVVKQGQLLAALSARQAEASVQDASAAVMQAAADLAEIKAGSSVEDINITKTRVDQAKVELTSKQNDFTQLTSENERNLISLREKLFNAINSSIFVIQNDLEDTNKLINEDNYETMLKISIADYNSAMQSYADCYDSLQSLNRDKVGISATSKTDDLLALAQKTINGLNNDNEMLSDTFVLLTKALAGGSLTQTLIDTFKTTISTDQTALTAQISATQTAKSNLEIQTVNYTNSLASAKTNIDKAQVALDVAQAELALKQAGPRSTQLSSYQAKLARANAQLASAQATLADYRLNAPIDGIISKINYEIGETAGGASNAMISLIGESNLEITVDVAESDIAKIKTGDVTSITLDAFGNEKVFAGHVSFIDPAETIINDVVYYKVKVVFDQAETEVKSGMTANVNIITAEKNDVLYIPARAVQIINNQRVAQILVNNQKENKEVTTGLRADDGLIEVVSGLNEGEQVITFTNTPAK